MGLAAVNLPDDLLPPELMVDELPITADELDEFSELVAKVADSVGCSRDEAVELLWEPPVPADGEDAFEFELPPLFRAAAELDEAKADWAMAHYAEAEAAIRAARGRHVVLTDKLDEWLNTALRRPESDKAYFGMVLKAYALQRRAETEAQGKMVATVTTPSGKIATRPRPAKLVVKGADAQRDVVAWLKEGVGAEWLEARVDDAADELPGLLAPDAAALDRQDVIDFLTRFAAELLTGDPYEGAVKVAETVLLDGLKGQVVITDARATDPSTGDVVPGIIVEPEGIGCTITPS